MASLDYLKDFEQQLQNEEFDVRLIEASDEMPFPYLIVDLGKDSSARDRFLKLRVNEQETGEGFLPKGYSPNSLLLSFDAELELPFTFDPLCTKELASLLLFLNHQVKVVILDMDEVENRIYYRYNMIATDKGIDIKVLLSVIGLILFFYDVYHKSIEEVSLGHITFNQILEQIILASKAKP